MAVLKNDASTTEVKPGITRKMIYGSDLMMVVIDFTNGPWAHHEQTSYIASGEIRFICEDESDQILSTGDMFFVPSGKQHTIQLLSESARLVDSFNPVRKDFI